ncbi:hypothetical protein LMH87_010975 [Akanthomyces muscarius]|uniref:Uncharacterized protein n=1 Tax=Akanthomyces muscarius TaxID=2231603 RepID=A0A9W8UKH4_AKAMU|nr:hypothetical protein LMH87_010975 [Akanthomyces muscarius]KAJ4150216.1 hypothetical protein LMH87_010975 [Akanthomyces muscarius]
MAVLPQATPLLLTKRLNAFLRAHTTPQLPTLLLTTYHGKLLAHASSASQPVSILRTHATVAASLLAIHTSSSVALPAALGGGSETNDPEHSAPPSDDEVDDDETARGTDDEADQHQQQQQAAATPGGSAVKPLTITVQLSGGTVIIRRLKCGLLLVCVGPSSHDTASSSAPSSDATATGPTPGATASSVGATAGNSSNNNGAVAAVTQALESAELLHATTTTTTETESLTSAGGQTTTTSSGDSSSGSASSVVAMRRYAAELARGLDEKLGTLSVPEDSTGAE